MSFGDDTLDPSYHGMTFSEYSARAMSTNRLQKIEISINGGPLIRADWILPILGLCGEVGEIAEKFKKLIRDDNGVMTEEREKAIQKEEGDPLWYLNALAYLHGSSLERTAEINLEKVESRLARGKLHGDGDDR